MPSSDIRIPSLHNERVLRDSLLFLQERSIRIYTGSSGTKMAETLRQLLLGPDGKLRLFWRAFLYYVVGTYVVFPLLDRVFDVASSSTGLDTGFTAGSIGFGEFRNLIAALLCTGVFARYEHRRVDSYGLPVKLAFRWHTFEGAVTGLVLAGIVGVGMLLLGGMQIKGLADSGGALAVSAVAWLAACISVGVAEEFWFRSYLQQTLWKSIGFWPSALVIALIFAAEHYFFKAGENVWDVITLVSLSLLMSYSILRTGTLWFSVGFHISFDYMQLFVIGTPNGGRVPVGRLLDATLEGPAWLTGGVLGTEASFLMYPAIVLLWLYVWWRYRSCPPLQP
jgi:uncharacterized protein